MKDLCQRYVDILDGRRAKVTLDTGKIYIGNGFQPCVATYKDGEEGDGICFKRDDTKEIIVLAEDEIKNVEFID